MDVASKRKSMGPLKVAALNGLSLSRGSVLDVLDQTASENSKAPKDERVSPNCFSQKCKILR